MATQRDKHDTGSPPVSASSHREEVLHGCTVKALTYTIGSPAAPLRTQQGAISFWRTVVTPGSVCIHTRTRWHIRFDIRPQTMVKEQAHDHTNIIYIYISR